MQETQVRSPGREDPLEKEMATHSSILAWRIPWTEEPGGLQSTGSQSRTRLSDYTFFLYTFKLKGHWKFFKYFYIKSVSSIDIYFSGCDSFLHSDANLIFSKLWTCYCELGYSQLATLWWFLANSEGTQPYTYMHPFPPSSLPAGSDGTAWIYNVGDLGLIPGSGGSLGGGHGNPLQYSCLENHPWT